MHAQISCAAGRFVRGAGRRPLEWSCLPRRTMLVSRIPRTSPQPSTLKLQNLKLWTTTPWIPNTKLSYLIWSPAPWTIHPTFSILIPTSCAPNPRPAVPHIPRTFPEPSILKPETRNPLYSIRFEINFYLWVWSEWTHQPSHPSVLLKLKT